jgi:hypothetical protein
MADRRNTPAIGWEEQGLYFVGSTRNVRVPVISRLDVRAKARSTGRRR